MEKMINLDNFANGAFAERVNEGLQQVLENLADPNTEWKPKRKLNIMLQSSFVDNKDRNLLLKVTGNVKDEAVKSVGDNGVSQAVTIKTGVASVSDVVVPNPVTLAPFRTFQEVEQPESKFIFRMKDGPSAALYEADGGAWRNEAMKNIKSSSKNSLKDLIMFQ